MVPMGSMPILAIDEKISTPGPEMFTFSLKLLVRQRKEVMVIPKCDVVVVRLLVSQKKGGNRRGEQQAASFDAAAPTCAMHNKTNVPEYGMLLVLINGCHGEYIWIISRKVAQHRWLKAGSISVEMCTQQRLKKTRVVNQ